jgi:hypothetical protein
MLRNCNVLVIAAHGSDVKVRWFFEDDLTTTPNLLTRLADQVLGHRDKLQKMLADPDADKAQLELARRELGECCAIATARIRAHKSKGCKSSKGNKTKP